jgi:fatty-acyl-CoA synthase
VMLQLGAALAGIVLVTVNPQFRGGELSYALGQSGAAGLFHGSEHRGVSMSDVVASVRVDLPQLRTAVCFDEWEQFVAAGHEVVAFPDIRPRDPCLIIYTSGTTGFAKGAVLHHLGVVNTSRFSAARAGFQEGDCWINPIPLFHTGGGVLAGVGCIAQRGKHVVVPQFEPGLVLELIEAERGSMVLTVPTILTALLDHPDLPRRDLTSLRTVMSGGANVAAELVRRTRATLGCDFSLLYGQAELHGTLTQTHPGDTDVDQAETLGRPLPRVEVKIAAAGSNEPVPVGQEGEICGRGYQTMLGYYNMTGPGQQVIDAEGWLHTGDAGSMDHRGYVRIAGRLKDIIIRGGENIHPREIEEALEAHPAVAQAAVIGVPDAYWGEQVAAVLLPRSPANPPPVPELQAYCRSRMAPFKSPRLWFFVQEFPMTPSGKIQKFVLREQVLSGGLVQQG